MLRASLIASVRFFSGKKDKRKPFIIILIYFFTYLLRFGGQVPPPSLRFMAYSGLFKHCVVCNNRIPFLTATLSAFFYLGEAHQTCPHCQNLKRGVLCSHLPRPKLHLWEQSLQPGKPINVQFHASCKSHGQVHFQSGKTMPLATRFCSEECDEVYFSN